MRLREERCRFCVALRCWKEMCRFFRPFRFLFLCAARATSHFDEVLAAAVSSTAVVSSAVGGSTDTDDRRRTCPGISVMVLDTLDLRIDVTGV